MKEDEWLTELRRKEWDKNDDIITFRRQVWHENEIPSDRKKDVMVFLGGLHGLSPVIARYDGTDSDFTGINGDYACCQWWLLQEGVRHVWCGYDQWAYVDDLIADYMRKPK